MVHLYAHQSAKQAKCSGGVLLCTHSHILRSTYSVHWAFLLGSSILDLRHKMKASVNCYGVGWLVDCSMLKLMECKMLFSQEFGTFVCECIRFRAFNMLLESILIKQMTLLWMDTLKFRMWKWMKLENFTSTT